MKRILTKLRQGLTWALIFVAALAMILAALMALTTLVASGLFLLNLPLWNLPSLDPATFKDVIANVQAVFTIFAIVVAGLFAIFKLQLFRDFEPHLTISQEVSHRFSSSSYIHIAVTSTLHNSSKVKVKVLKGLCRVQQILPVTDEEFIRLSDQAFKGSTYEFFQWYTLQEAKRTWEKYPVVVEPGESHQETYEFMIGSEVRSILAYTYIYNSRRRQGSQDVVGWHGTTVYDIAKP